MKIIFAIIASEGEEYNDFKLSWIKNIKYILNNPLLRNVYSFNFLYSDPNKQKNDIRSDDGHVIYSDFYNDDIESNITHSIFKRTISFILYLKSTLNFDDSDVYIKYNTEGFYFIRTNISTIFDLNLLYNWLQNKPKTNFFGGNFIGCFNGFKTIMSGTCLLMSFDLMLFLSLNNLNYIKFECNEDEFISLVLGQLYKHIYIMNIKRIDFIEMKEVVLSTHTWPSTPPSIIYQKCRIGENDIFCFRFKTFDRKNDIILMQNVIEKINHPYYNLDNMIGFFLENTNLQLNEENPEYGELYSIKPFKIS